MTGVQCQHNHRPAGNFVAATDRVNESRTPSAGLAVCKILGIRAKPSSPPTRARAMEPAGRKGSSEAETAEARTARLSREVAHSVEFHKERLAADFPFVKPEYLQKFALMGAVAEKKK